MSKATLHYSRPRLPRRLARQQHPGLKSKLELTAVCDDNSHHYYQLSFCLSEQRFVGLEIILKNYFYVSMNGWVKCFGWGGVQEWQIFSFGLVYWEFSSCFWPIFLIVPFCSRPVAVRTGPAPVRGPTIFSAAIICNNWARAAALLGPASTPHLPGFFPGLCLVHRGSLGGHSSIPDNPFSQKKGVSKGSSTKPIWKQDNFSGIIIFCVCWWTIPLESPILKPSVGLSLQCDCWGWARVIGGQIATLHRGNILPSPNKAPAIITLHQAQAAN